MKEKAKHITKSAKEKKPESVKKIIVRKKAVSKKQKKVTALASRLVGLHTLRAPHGAHKRRKLLGRGSSSGHGKTSTRGSKGQTSRAGRHFYLGFEGGQSPIIRRMPKRGFTNIFKKEYQLVNLKDLNRIKEATVTLQILEEKGLIKDKAKLVKILGTGEIKQAFTVQAHAFSRKAMELINNAGGRAEIVNV